MTERLKKDWLLVLLIVTTPVFFWTILNFGDVVSRWLEIPSGLGQRKSLLFAPEAVGKILKMRRAQIDSNGPIFIFSKLVYNKAYIVLNELFGYTAYIKPRFYFQAGDSSALSPPNTNPAPFLLLPFWLYGILLSFKNKNHRLLLVWFASTLFAFIVGFRSFAILVPAIIVNFIFAYKALGEVKRRKVRLGLVIAIVFLGLFETARSIYLFF